MIRTYDQSTTEGRIACYLEINRIKQIDFARKLGIAPTYLSGILKGNYKVTGGKFWTAIRDHAPECEDYFRGKTDIVPGLPGNKTVKTETKPPAAINETSNETYGADLARSHDKGFSVAEDMAMAAGVLESDTPYSLALHLNIRSFHRAVDAEKKQITVMDTVDDLQKQVQELKREVLLLRGQLSDDEATSSETG